MIENNRYTLRPKLYLLTDFRCSQFYVQTNYRKFIKSTGISANESQPWADT